MSLPHRRLIRSRTVYFVSFAARATQRSVVLHAMQRVTAVRNASTRPSSNTNAVPQFLPISVRFGVRARPEHGFVQLYIRPEDLVKVGLLARLGPSSHWEAQFMSSLFVPSNLLPEKAQHLSVVWRSDPHLPTRWSSPWAAASASMAASPAPPTSNDPSICFQALEVPLGPSRYMRMTSPPEPDASHEEDPVEDEYAPTTVTLTRGAVELVRYVIGTGLVQLHACDPLGVGRCKNSTRRANWSAISVVVRLVHPSGGCCPTVADYERRSDGGIVGVT